MFILISNHSAQSLDLVEYKGKSIGAIQQFQLSRFIFFYIEMEIERELSSHINLPKD